MDLKYIDLNIEAGVGWIRINRPQKLNALNPEVMSDLEQAIIAVEADAAVRVVVLTGNEKAFVAGADIEHMSTGDIKSAYDLTDLTLRVQERLADMAKPTIAMIAGYALGGGCELALCCDFRMAAETAVLGQPEIKLGIIPGGGGTQRLARLVGLGPATRLVFLGETVDAQKALSIGLVDTVVPVDALKKETQKLAGKLMQRPALALRAAKCAMRTGLNGSLKDGLKIEQDLFCMLFGTHDQKEGMKAFMEKRKAQFRGC